MFWGHVTGLQAPLLGHLKGFVKSLGNPEQKETGLAVIPAYLAYLEAYYHQLSRQVLLPVTHFLPVTVSIKPHLCCIFQTNQMQFK